MLNRIIAILFIIAATVGYSVYQKKSLEEQLVTKSETVLRQLPQSVFETLDGKSFDVHQFYATERVELLVVHYWGTWCAPCEAELPDLLGFIRRFETRPGVKFLLVAVNDEVFKIKKHLKSLGIPRSSIVWLLDNKNIHRDIYGTTRVPETYVFSSDKTTLRKYVGPQEWNKTMFFQTFDDFLQISNHKL
jgi:thiol-disulfide isomerase/thioredoxin